MVYRAATMLTVFSLCLVGCGGVSEDLGFGRHAPDEFAVVERPPLALPPDYALRPPAPGAARPQEVGMRDKAREITHGGAPRAEMAPASDAEKALLSAAGAEKAPSDIRETIDHEAAARVSANEKLVDDILFWRKSDPPGTTVDAAAESARIKDAKEKGEPVNASPTPVIEKNKSGWLGL